MVHRAITDHRRLSLWEQTILAVNGDRSQPPVHEHWYGDAAQRALYAPTKALLKSIA